MPQDLPQHRTARRFKHPPPLFRWAKERGYFDNPGRGLVFGAGLLVEAEALLDLKWSVDALETDASVSFREDLYSEFRSNKGARLISSLDDAAKSYRLVTVTHVLEFIPRPAERTRTLRALGGKLAKAGVLLLSLRGWSDVNAAKSKRPHADGIITGLGTFTRGYTIQEAEDLIGAANLKILDSPHGNRAKRPEQVRVICQTV